MMPAKSFLYRAIDCIRDMVTAWFWKEETTRAATYCSPGIHTHTHTLSLLRSCAVYASVANIWGCLNPKPFWPQENAAVLSTVYPNYFCTLKVSAAALKVLPFCVSVFFSSCFFCGCCPASHFFLLLFFSLVFLFVLSLFSSWVFLGFLGFLLS